MKKMFTKEKVKVFFKELWTERNFRISIDIFRSLLMTMLLLFTLAAFLAFGIGIGYFASLVRNEPLLTKEQLSKQIYQYEESTELYLANNDYLGTLRTDLHRQHVGINDISPFIIDALISTEDEYFYEHQGIVPKAVFRALFQEATNASMQSGGSTLTQQLVKNQLLTNEVSFERKAREILLALRVEKLFTKDEILEAYLNVVSFGRNSSGQNIAGIQSAAKGIFGKDAKDVTLPQAAFLAGLPQSPFGYTPFTQNATVKEDLSAVLNRMKIVLLSMKRDNKITDEQYNEAVAYDITKDFIKPLPTPMEEYPFLTNEIELRATDLLIDIIAKEDGYEIKDLERNSELRDEYRAIANRTLRQNGYKIYTTIDRKIYDAMEKVKDNFDYGPSKYRKSKDKNIPIDVGAMLIDNKTGAILSFVGGRDFNQSQVNKATSYPRQNGSTMKPLLVYAPAIEEGLLQPGMLVADVQTTFHIPGQESYSPNNYDFKFHGLLPAREALARSYNLPVLRMYYNMQQLGLNPMEYVEKMGFTNLRNNDYGSLSVSLGGLTNGVTVEENINAYTTFANGGEFVDAFMIERIIDKNGNTIYEHETVKNRVFSAETAYLTIDMMRDTTTYGTGSSLHRRMNYTSDWAAKSGTTQDQMDTWFVATNPDVTFGTWFGYEAGYGEKMTLPSGTSLKTLILWTELMNAAYKAAPTKVGANKTFTKPSGVEKRTFNALTGGSATISSSLTGHVRTDWFNKNFEASDANVGYKKEKYVEIGSKAYGVLDNTPKAFIKSDYTLSSTADSFTLGLLGQDSPNLSQLLGSNALTVKDPAAIVDGKKPSTVANVQFSNGTLTWSANSEKDVIGYYVYEYKRNSNNPRKIRTVTVNEDLYLSLIEHKNLGYAVTAIDIEGKESSLIPPVFNSESESPSEDNDESDADESDTDIDDILMP